MIEIEQGARAPLYPPDEWLSQAAADAAPSLPAGADGGPLKLTVHPGGRVSGLIAPSGVCLIGGAGGECWQIPKPRDEAKEYYRAHGGWTRTASGAVVATAVIGGGKGHASEWATTTNAQAFYADTSTQLMRGVYRWSDVAGGLTFVGALWPEVSERQVAGIMASPASIDYRLIREEGDYRLVGSCLVNIPGFPAKWKMAARRVAAAMILTPVLADASGPSTGTMVALRIDAPSLVMPGGTDPAELHVTLGYFGDAATFPDEVRAVAIEQVGQAIIANGRPLLLEVNGPAVLGPIEDMVTVLLVQGAGLCELRDVLLAACERAGMIVESTYPVWIPHITLGPLESVPMDVALGFKGVTISPPSVVLAFGSAAWTEYELPTVGLPYGILGDASGCEVCSAPLMVAATVTSVEEASMICESCQTHVAAPPPPVADDRGATTDTEALAARVSDLEAQVAALTDAIAGVQMAALSAPLQIPQLVS